MVGVQTAVGGGTEGVHTSVVELAGFHHALSLSHNIQSPFRCLLPDRIRQIRSPRTGPEALALV